MGELIRRHWRMLCVLALALGMALVADATEPKMTQISDVLYRADGRPARGTMTISWPAFTTKEQAAIAAGSKEVTIGDGGAVSLELAPNSGSDPQGTYYRVVLHFDDHTTDTEYWTVPDNPTAKLAEIRAKLVTAATAAQFASREYVDKTVANTVNSPALVHTAGDESISGVKDFAAAPHVPAPQAAQDAANKAYVDSVSGTPAMSYAGQNYGGATTIQAAINNAGNTGSVTIPSNYAGSDSYTNAQGVPVLDLRDGPASLTGYLNIRSFGAKCDGKTNDLAAVQAGVTSAISSGRVLYFPAGTCFVMFTAQQNSILVTGNLHIIGAGRGQAILKVGPETPTFSYYGFQHASNANLVVEDLTVQGPSDAGPNGGNNQWTAAFYEPGGTGAGSLTLRRVGVEGQWFQALAKASTNDDKKTVFKTLLDDVDMTSFALMASYYTGFGTQASDAMMTAGSANLASASSTFTTNDVGSRVQVAGAGANGKTLVSRITAFVNANNVTLADSAATTTTAARTVTDGAMQTDRTVADASMTIGSPYLNSATANFTSNDKGRIVQVNGAGIGGTNLVSVIVNIESAQQVRLRTASVTAVSGASVTIKGDGKLISATAAFTPSDVNKSITVNGAGASGTNLTTTIAKVINGTTVWLMADPVVSVTNASVSIGGNQFAHGIPNVSLEVRNSYFHDIVNYSNVAGYRWYFFYVHPHIAFRFLNNRFDNGPHFALHVYSSSIPYWMQSDNAEVTGNDFGPGVGTYDAAILSHAPNLRMTNNTFRNANHAVQLDGNGGIFEGNRFAMGGQALYTLGTGARDISVIVRGGRIEQRTSGGVAVVPAFPLSTWSFENVDFVSHDSTGSPISSGSDRDVTVNVRNSAFHGVYGYAINLSRGAGNITNNLFDGNAATAHINVSTDNVTAVDISNNTFGGSSATNRSITTSGLHLGAVTGQNNRFAGAGGPSAVNRATALLGNKPGLYPTAISSGSNVNLGVGTMPALSGYNYDTFHVSGTATIDNLYVDDSTRVQLFAGRVTLIADGAWSVSGTGNVKPLTTGSRTVGKAYTFFYDPIAGFWYEQ